MQLITKYLIFMSSLLTNMQFISGTVAVTGAALLLFEDYVRPQICKIQNAFKSHLELEQSQMEAARLKKELAKQKNLIKSLEETLKSKEAYTQLFSTQLVKLQTEYSDLQASTYETTFELEEELAASKLSVNRAELSESRLLQELQSIKAQTHCLLEEIELEKTSADSAHSEKLQTLTEALYDAEAQETKAYEYWEHAKAEVKKMQDQQVGLLNKLEQVESTHAEQIQELEAEKKRLELTLRQSQESTALLKAHYEEALDQVYNESYELIQSYEQRLRDQDLKIQQLSASLL